MHLKEHLKKRINITINRLHKDIEEKEQALKLLKKIDLNRADYIVSAFPIRFDNCLRQIAVKHTGSLEDAIALAEESLKQANKRPDEAIYHVSVILGDERYTVPMEYWEKYKEH